MKLLIKGNQFLVVQRLFEPSNKSGRFLPNQLKINKEKTTICSVKVLTGNTVYDPDRINNSFRDSYNTLYSPQINPKTKLINSLIT